jgi:uncharacterized protein with NRDE domain
VCLIAWNWQPESETPLLLLANRDEFYTRPTLPLHWWDDGRILAGQDLQAGGTWLGVSRSGRLAAITNYRLSTLNAGTKPSRGALVSDFLTGIESAQSYLESLIRRADAFNPFNLLVFDGQRFMGLESRSKRVLEIRPGLGAVSNADFDTPWPKLVRLKIGLQKRIHLGQIDTPHLLPLLQDPSRPDDTELPSTGVPLELERMLSATFVSSQHYGTRACSIVRLSHRQFSFFEHCCGAQGVLGQSKEFFRL